MYSHKKIGYRVSDKRPKKIGYRANGWEQKKPTKKSRFKKAKKLQKKDPKILGGRSKKSVFGFDCDRPGGEITPLPYLSQKCIHPFIRLGYNTSD